MVIFKDDIKEWIESEHNATPIIFRLPKLGKRRKYSLRECKVSDWQEKNLIAVDTETTVEFPKRLRTIQLYIGKNKRLILGTDEPELEIQACMDNIEVYSIAEVKTFMQIVPFLGYRFIFFNAAFDVGQLGFSHFRKRFSLIDMKLWKLKVKKLTSGCTFIKGYPRSKYLAWYFQLRAQYKYNPIIQKYFKREFRELEELISAAYDLWDKKDAYKYLRKRLYVNDFVLDISTLAAVFFYRMSLASLCKVLGIQVGKKDYNYKKPLLEQLKVIMHHAKVTMECNRRLLKIIFYDMKIKPNPCYIVSPASLTKYTFSKMNLRRPKFEKDEVLGQKWGFDSLMQNIMTSYYGGRVECRVKKRMVDKVYIDDFVSLYPHIARLMGLWDLMKAETLTIVRNTRKAQIIYKRANLEYLRDPENWKDLNLLCQVYCGKKDGGLLPLRVERGIKKAMIVTQGELKHSIGWYMLSDVIASKIRGYEDIEIMEAFEMKPTGIQKLKPVEIGNKDTKTVIDGLKDDFFKKMLDLRFKYKKGTGMYQLIKLVVNSAYGVTCERNRDEGGYNPNKERIDPVTPLPVGLTIVMPTRIDKAGIYFNPFIGSNITAGGRLTLAISEAMSDTFTYADTDSIFLQDENEMVQLEKYFEPLIPLKREAEGKFYCTSEKRYVVYTEDDEGNMNIISAKEHGLKNYVNVRNKDRIHAIWKHILGKRHTWKENEVVMTTEQLLNERAVRKMSLHSDHLTKPMVKSDRYNVRDLKIGDFFYVNVKETGKRHKTVIGGDVESLQRNCDELNQGKTIRDCIDAFMIHDSGKITNSLAGYGKFLKFRLTGVRLINKRGSKLRESPNNMVEIWENEIVITPTVIPNYGYSSHKYGKSNVPSNKKRMFT